MTNIEKFAQLAAKLRGTFGYQSIANTSADAIDQLIARVRELEAEVLAVTTEYHVVRKTMHTDWCNQVADLTEKLRVALGIIDRISKQTPDKPDYWSSCSQCEYNISDCEDALATIGNV